MGLRRGRDGRYMPRRCSIKPVQAPARPAPPPLAPPPPGRRRLRLGPPYSCHRKGALAVRTQRLTPTRLGPAASPAGLEQQLARTGALHRGHSPRVPGRSPAAHPHPSRTHNTETGPVDGDCMLRGGCCDIETHHWDSTVAYSPTHATCRKPALDRLTHLAPSSVVT